MAGECDKGLTPDCFKTYPNWAKQAFAYRLLYTIIPKRLSKNLPRAFRIPLIFRDIIVPPGVNLPPGSIVGPGSTILPGWTPGDPVPAGMFYGPTYSLPPGWTPGDQILPGVIDPSFFPPGFDISGYYSLLSTDFLPPGPPGPPGQTSRSGYPSVSPGIDLLDTEITSSGYAGYYVSTPPNDFPYDNDLASRAHWKKTTAPGSSASAFDMNFIGNAQVINGLRVYNLQNDAGSTWTFGMYSPGWTVLLTGIQNVTGWSDVYTFDNLVSSQFYRIIADDALDTLNQESWLFEMEVYNY